MTPEAVCERRTCKRCGQLTAVTPSGHLRAHECPHGSQCVVPYARRRTGEQPAHCGTCANGAPDTRLEPGQLPFPFRGGIRRKLTKRNKRERFAVMGGGFGHACPVCGCGPGGVRCPVALNGGQGFGVCVPAGTFGRKTCSACRQPTLPGVEPT